MMMTMTMTTMPNKYNFHEFIQACNSDPQIQRLLASGRIEKVTLDVLKKFDIKPNREGQYTRSQIFTLHGRLNQERKLLYDSVSAVPTLGRLKEFDPTLDIKPDAPEIRRFLLVTLSTKFQKEVEAIRKKYEIPPGGFNDEGEFHAWDGRMKSLAERELKSVKGVDYILMRKRLPGYTFGESHYDNIFTSLGRLKHEMEQLFGYYQLRLPFVGLLYVVWEFRNHSIVSFLNELNPKPPLRSAVFPFHTTTRWKPENKDSSNADIRWVMPHDTYYLAIKRPVTKKELLTYINDNWKMMTAEMNEFYNWSALNADFRRDWLIYAYHQRGKSYKEIAALLKFDYKLGEVSASTVKKIIQRLKVRVAQIEAGTRK